MREIQVRISVKEQECESEKVGGLYRRCPPHNVPSVALCFVATIDRCLRFALFDRIATCFLQYQTILHELWNASCLGPVHLPGISGLGSAK